MVPLTIIHIADTHLGRSPDRDEASFGVLAAALHRAQSLNAVFVHSGDLTDKALLNTIGAPFERLIDVCLATPNISKVFLRGTPTHDVDGALDFLKPLPNVMVADTWALLPLTRDAAGVYSWQHSQIDEVVAVFYCLPEPSKANLAASGVDAALLDASLQEATRQSLMAFRYHDDWPPEAPRILVAHLRISGASTSSGFAPQSSLNAENLMEHSGADVVLLGDIHKRQIFCSGRAAYCGSPIPLDFGEIEENKGYLVWRFEGRLPQPPEIVSSPYQQLVTVEVADQLSPEGEAMIMTGDGEPILAANALSGSVLDGAQIKIKAPAQFRAPGSPQAAALETLIAWLKSQAVRILPVQYAASVTQMKKRSDKIVSLSRLADELLEWGEIHHIRIGPGHMQKAGKVQSQCGHLSGEAL